MIEYFLKESRQSRYFHELPTQLTTEDWGFAVKKGNKKVLNALNSALVSLQKDGHGREDPQEVVQQLRSRSILAQGNVSEYLQSD